MSEVTLQEHPVAEHPADTHEHDPHGQSHGWHVHVVPLPLLAGVFIALMFLTWVTVAVTAVDFGPFANLMVAMAVAGAKALLVALYFMHLRWDNPFNTLIFISALIFVTLMIAFCMVDSFSYYSAYIQPQGVPVP